MGGKLVIVDDDVRDLMTGIASVRHTFDCIPEGTHVSQWAGHTGLADAIEAFLGDWRFTREKVQESLKTVYENVKQVNDTFAQLDSEIATQMNATSMTAPK